MKSRHFRRHPPSLRRCLRASLLLVAVLSTSCGIFYRQPALPKHAAIESSVTPEADDKLASLVQNADIIYFPAELMGTAARSDSALKLIEALHRNGGAFGVGFDVIGGEEQAVLDRWAQQNLSAVDVMPPIHLSGTGRERETYRAFLREARKLGARFLALRCPPGLLKAAPSTHEATALEEDFAAEKVAAHFREHRGEKMVVFLQRRSLAGNRGLPHLVAEKVRARQLVFDSRPQPSLRPRLLAGRDGGRLGRRLEIIDGPPGTGRDPL